MKKKNILNSIELRKFGFNLGLGLNILGCIMFYRGREHFIYFSTIGSLALMLAILRPGLLKPLKKVLDLVISAFGKTVNMITLLAAFYLMFTPISFLLRLLGKDLLHQKINKSSLSYWTRHKKLTSSYERMG